MTHRTVFPHLLIGLCALFVLALFALNSWDGNQEASGERLVEQDKGVELRSSANFGSQQLPGVTNEDYETWLSTWLTDVLAAEESELAGLREELFDVTVPAAYKPLHLDLVFLMEQEGSALSADQRAQLEQFNQQF